MVGSRAVAMIMAALTTCAFTRQVHAQDEAPPPETPAQPPPQADVPRQPEEPPPSEAPPRPEPPPQPAREAGRAPWLSLAGHPVEPALSAFAHGFYLGVPHTDDRPGNGYTGAGGGGVGARAGVIVGFAAAKHRAAFAGRAGVGIDFFYGIVSPQGTSETRSLTYLQVPFHAGVVIDAGRALTLGVDWQPTVQIAHINGSDAVLTNPFGLDLTIDLLVHDEPALHPRAIGFLLMPIGSLPLTTGGGLGASFQ